MRPVEDAGLGGSVPGCICNVRKTLERVLLWERRVTYEKRSVFRTMEGIV